MLLEFVAFPSRFPFRLFRSIAEKKNECAGVTSAEVRMGFPNICLICEQPFISVDKPKTYFCPEHRNLSLYRDANALIRQLNPARKAGVPATLTWGQWSKTIEDFDLWCAYRGRGFTMLWSISFPLSTEAELPLTIASPLVSGVIAARAADCQRSACWHAGKWKRQGVFSTAQGRRARERLARTVFN